MKSYQPYLLYIQNPIHPSHIHTFGNIHTFHQYKRVFLNSLNNEQSKIRWVSEIENFGKSNITIYDIVQIHHMMDPVLQTIYENKFKIT